MANKIIMCKTCGAEMASSAKACPKCGAKNKKPIYAKWWFYLLLVIIVCGIIGGAGSSGPKKVDSTDKNTNETQTEATDGAENETSPENTEKQSTFRVGDSVEYEKVIVTLNTVTENEGGGLFTPSEGNVFVLFELTIENNSSREMAISSILSFEAYCDDFACNYSLSAKQTSDKNQLDGTVAAGKKMNGVIGYEVPADWKEMELHFAPSVWVSKEFVFAATHEDIQ